MSKTAKDYYSDIFEGIRLVVCGVAMLGVCGCRGVVNIFKPKGYEKESKFPHWKEVKTEMEELENANKD